jgi:GNAT superfamily N-acetyltransferase
VDAVPADPAEDLMDIVPETVRPGVRRVAVDIILPLRHAVLRADLPASSACFAGDTAGSTIHLAALAAGEPVACASFMEVPFDGESAYQLRGMATAPAWQGRGLGRQLLEHAELLLRDDPIRLRWCNARTSALGFYAKMGWTVVSDEFDIPTAGAHRRMIARAPAVAPGPGAP